MYDERCLKIIGANIKRSEYVAASVRVSWLGLWLSVKRI